MFEVLSPDFTHKDDRGELIQLVHEGYKQVNVIYSKGGTVRGGHYHQENREAFYVVRGACEVQFAKEGQTESQVFRTGAFFQIEPEVGHSFRYLEDTILVGLYDKGVELENGKKDIVEL